MREGYSREDLAAVIEAAGFDLRRVERALLQASRAANSPYVSREQVLRCLSVDGDAGAARGEDAAGAAPPAADL